MCLDKSKTEVFKDGAESELVFILWLAVSFFEQSSREGNLLACLYCPPFLFLFDGGHYLDCHPLVFAGGEHTFVADQKHVFERSHVNWQRQP